MVSPELHNQEVPALAESVTVPPAQNVMGPPAIMLATGKAKTVTGTIIEFVEQPLALVTVTDRFPLLFTEIDCVVSPVFHNQVLPVAAVRFTELPAQKPVGPLAEILLEGDAFTVIKTLEDEAEHPLASVTVTDLLIPVLTVTICEISPVFQSQLLPTLAVRFTDPPEQKVVGPFAEMVTTGNGFTRSGTKDETAEQPMA